MSALARQVTFAHRNTDKQLCIYTDTSDTVWSGVVFQISQWNMVKSHQEQRHEPLGFLSGRFNLTQLGWSVLEKKAYAVLSLFSRMHWLTATSPGFDFFMDHDNLVFLFDPLSIVPDISQTALRKVLRWAVRLSIYSNMYIHTSVDRTSYRLTYLDVDLLHPSVDELSVSQSYLLPLQVTSTGPQQEMLQMLRPSTGKRDLAICFKLTVCR